MPFSPRGLLLLHQSRITRDTTKPLRPRIEIIQNTGILTHSRKMATLGQTPTGLLTMHPPLDSEGRP